MFCGVSFMFCGVWHASCDIDPPVTKATRDSRKAIRLAGDRGYKFIQPLRLIHQCDIYRQKDELARACLSYRRKRPYALSKNDCITFLHELFFCSTRVRLLSTSGVVDC